MHSLYREPLSADEAAALIGAMGTADPTTARGVLRDLITGHLTLVRSVAALSQWRPDFFVSSPSYVIEHSFYGTDGWSGR